MIPIATRFGRLLRLAGGLAVLTTSQATMAQSNGCGLAPTAAEGLQITPFATGFVARAFSFGGINFVCHGPGKGAFVNRALIVADGPTGTLYRFDTGGGPADAAHVLTATPLSPGSESLAVGRGGRLYSTQVATTGNFLTGSVVEIDPVTGELLRTVAANITCANGLAVDPLSGDLFVSDACAGAGSDNPSIWRIARPASASPAVSIYATAPGPANTSSVFAPDGTLFLFSAGNLVRISGTNKPQPASVTTLPGAQFTGNGLAIGRVEPDSSARSVYMTTGGNVAEVDLTTNPIRVVRTLIHSLSGQTGYIVPGRDRCLYVSSDVEVLRLTNADGTCDFVDTRPRLNIADARVTEGNAGTGTLNFTVTLSPAARGAVSVRFATTNGSAKAGSDYVALARTLSFSRGESSKSVSVAINGDSAAERNETFFGNLRSPRGATIVDGRGLARIANDD